MGTSHSSPAENIWKAANSNRPVELARHIANLQSNPNGWNRSVLEWKDKLGRTPLILCARENRTACAQVLLQAGADVHYINFAPEGRGSALHEAAHRDADEMVILLLRYGASPWVANKFGRTALDEAVLSSACGPIWRFKQLAPHFSAAMVKTVRLGGLSNPYKARHLLVVPFIPCPQNGRPSAQPPRKQLWFFTDEKAITPKVRVWLCGATLLLGPRETLLRLHPTHGHPGGDLHTRFQGGFCISMRPLNTLPSTLVTFQHLLDTCCPGSTFGPGVGAAASPLTAHSPGGHGTSPSRPTLPPPTPGAPAPGPTGPGYLFSDAHARELSQSMARAQDPAPPDASMQALPGESDTEFAARLAAMLSGDVPLPPQPSSCTGGPLPSSPPVPGAASPFPAMPSFPHSLSGSPAPPPHDAQRARERWHNAEGEPTFQQQQSGNLGVASAPAGLQQQSPSPPSPPPFAHTGRGSIADGVPGEPASPPSAPPLFSQPSQSDLAPAPSDQSQGEEAQCVICLSAPRECGFLHGSSMHLCVCRDCKKMTPPGHHCPLCRQTIERVIDVF